MISQNIIIPRRAGYVPPLPWPGPPPRKPALPAACAYCGRATGATASCLGCGAPATRKQR